MLSVGFKISQINVSTPISRSACNRSCSLVVFKLFVLFSHRLRRKTKHLAIKIPPDGGFSQVATGGQQGHFPSVFQVKEKPQSSSSSKGVQPQKLHFH